MKTGTMIIGEKTVRRYLTVEDAIECVEKTWRWYGEGKVVMPNKITTDMSELGIPSFTLPLNRFQNTEE